ncbi:MAG: toprim domain-containing protein [Deltaproteobacteria bacterium]|nr:toprim domain-containing protein [Deltaproteobacteria bacterium]
METYPNIKSAATIDAMIRYAETLLGIRFTSIRKNRYSALCPFHADTKESFMVYVNKDDEVRFHCFGACKGDWDIYDLIMLRKKYPFRKAQQVWAAQLGVENFKFNGGSSPGIPEPDETPEPDEPVGFVEPKKRDEKMVAALEEAATFYNDLLMSNEDRFKPIWEYLARRGVGKETIGKFNIGYAPPYSDEQYSGRALIDCFLPHFEKDADAFSNGGLFRFLNDATVKGYGYYCRKIDFRRKDPVSRNYGDFLAGRMVFPIYDADARAIGLVGRRPGDRGVRWLKHQTREVPLSARSWLYGMDKAQHNIRQYRTIILVEGLFDYFAFTNLLKDQDKQVVVSTLGSYLTSEAAVILKGLDIQHYIVAYDWDELGRNGIERIAAKTGGWVYYLGGLADGQDPYDMLKPVVDTISGFPLKHVL